MLLKRIVDLAVSAALLVFLLPLYAAIALAVVLDSGRPVFFTQTRIGYHFQPFRIWKFRTMKHRAEGTPITIAGDNRITRVGRKLRDSKLDELPQLWNILRGDMSLVGPRPEVPEFIPMFRTRFERILTVRPGLTDLASLEFRDEEILLGRAADPLTLYREKILPAKLSLAEHYIAHRSFWLDLKIIARTAQPFMKHGS